MYNNRNIDENRTYTNTNDVNGLLIAQGSSFYNKKNFINIVQNKSYCCYLSGLSFILFYFFLAKCVIEMRGAGAYRRLKIFPRLGRRGRYP